MASKTATMPKVFRGEGDALVEALVEACLPRNRPSLECPSQPHLIGRTLTPYFGSSEPVMGEAPETKQPSAGNKRKGSPPNLTRPRATSPASNVIDGSALPAVKTPATAASNCGKMQRSAKALEHAAVSTPAKAAEHGTATHKKKNPTRAMLDSAIATVLTAPSPYACPGMFSSPKPETLPMPTSRLLLRAQHTCLPMAVSAA